MEMGGLDPVRTGCSGWRGIGFFGSCCVGLKGDVLVLFVNDQFCGRVCSGYDMHSVYFGLVSLYLVRDVFEQNFEIVEEE